MTGPVAVTGAGGYVGGRVVASLVAAGIEVRAFARRPVPWLAAPPLVRDLAVAEVEGLARDLEGCSAVIHLAGANEVQAAADPDGSLATTVASGRRVAAAALTAGVDRLVLLSTTHVYGPPAPGAVVSTATLPAPRHPYAIARLALEHTAATVGPSELVTLRLTNAVGAPADARVERWSLVANDLCRQAASGPTVQLHSSGHQWRDFIALGDATNAIAAAASGAVPAGTYDLGSGHSRRVLDLAHEVATVAEELTGRLTAVRAPAHVGASPEASHVDVGPLTALGIETTTSLRAEILATIRACIDGPAATPRTATVRS